MLFCLKGMVYRMVASNQTLAEEVRKDIIEGEKTKQILLKSKKSDIKFFVRENQLQKTFPARTIGQESFDGITEGVLEKIGTYTHQMIIRETEALTHGYLHVSYEVSEDGKRFKSFVIYFEHEYQIN